MIEWFFPLFFGLHNTRVCKISLDLTNPRFYSSVPVAFNNRPLCVFVIKCFLNNFIIITICHFCSCNYGRKRERPCAAVGWHALCAPLAPTN